MSQDKLTVDLGGDWRAYTSMAMGFGMEPLGTAELDGKTGALVKIGVRGRYRYALMSDGEPPRNVDGRTVAAALGTVGRPKEFKHGRSVNVRLDEAHVELARKIGDGNMSAGIRRALEASK